MEYRGKVYGNCPSAWCWSIGGNTEGMCPGFPGIWQATEKTRPNWTEEYPYLKAAIQFLGERLANTSLESWALDKVWGAMATRPRLKHVLPDLPHAPTPPPDWDFWGVASFELSLTVAQIYGEKLEPKIKEATERNGSVKTEIQKLEAGDCIISLNYDLKQKGFWTN